MLKKSGPIFCLPPFSNIEKNTLTNLQKTWSNFLLIPFLNIKKNYTYKSSKNLAQFFAYLYFKY